MNSVHDMGGMEGMGPVEYEQDEPVFHADWEARVLACAFAIGAWGNFNADARRHTRERIPGPDYLRMSYYEKWLAGLETQLVETGLLTPGELATLRPAPGSTKATPPLTPDKVVPGLNRGNPVRRDVGRDPRFGVGDAVRTRNIHPHGHTRLPRYARAKPGVIHAFHGFHVFPDSNAHFRGEDPHPLYSVRIEAGELWGPDARGRDAVYLDLWEPYLEPA